MGVWDRLGDGGYQAAMLSHAAQPEVTEAITALIREMRTTNGRDDVRELQEHLAEFVVDADIRLGEAKRRLKRDPRWQREVDFWRRVTRQYRAVGDGIAWRFLDYRRQWLVFLGRNQAPGPTTKNEGFKDEWAKFQEHWEAGEPTVLNALTNRVTAGDLMVARGDTLHTIEVKRDPRSSRPDQMRRLREIERQLNHEPRVDDASGPTWIIESTVPLASHWTGAQPHVRRAGEAGAATWVPSDGVGVLFTSWRAALATGPERAAENLRTEQAKAREQLGPIHHRILMHSYNYPYLPSRAAPYSIFPVDPEDAAALITGDLLYTVELDLDVIADRMRQHGITVHSLLDDVPSGPLPPAFLAWTHGNSRGVLNSGSVEQLGLELMALEPWLEALAASTLPPGPERRWSAYLCFADEGRTWA